MSIGRPMICFEKGSNKTLWLDSENCCNEIIPVTADCYFGLFFLYYLKWPPNVNLRGFFFCFVFVLEEEKEEEDEEEEENTLNEPEIQLLQPTWLGARSFWQKNYTQSGIPHSDKIRNANHSVGLIWRLCMVDENSKVSRLNPLLGHLLSLPLP